MLLFLLSYIQIVSSSHSLIEIEVKTPEFDTLRIENYIFIRGNRDVPVFKPGEPNLPVILLEVAIPPGKKPRVVFKPQEEESYILPEELSPVPEIENDGLNWFYPSPSYDKNIYPLQAYQVLGISWRRSVKVVQILFFPYRYEPRTKKLLKFTDARFIIHLEDTGKRDYIYLRKEEPIKRAIHSLNYKEGRFLPAVPKVENEAYSFFAEKPFWIKIPINKDGLYAITYNQLRGLGVFPDDYPVDGFGLYSIMGKRLPSTIDSTYQYLNLVPDTVSFWILDHNQEGVFEDGDTLLFYGISANRVEVNNDSFQYYENPVTDKNVYWLVLNNGDFRLMDTLSVSPTGNHDIIRKSSLGFFRHEKNEVNLARRGLRWVGEYLYRVKTPSASYTFPFELKNIIGSSANLELEFIRIKKDIIGFTLLIEINGESIFQKYYPSPNVNIAENIKLSLDNLNTQNFLNIVLSEDPTQDTLDRVRLDYFSLTYERYLVQEETQNIYDTLNKRILYKFPAQDKGWLLNVTDPSKPILLRGAELKEDTLSFEVQGQPAQHIFYARTPHPVRNLNLVDELISLRDTTQRANYIIITHESLKPSLFSYLNWRRSRLYLGDSLIPAPEIRVITVDEVYDAFGFGLPDPISIRNFLGYAYFFWEEPKPLYVLLAGDGTLDYKGYSGNPVNLVPPYEFGYPIDTEVFGSYTYDDFYIQFDPGSNDPQDMIIGRIPAQSPAEFSNYLNKLLRYEREDNNGQWRNRVIGVADDDLQNGLLFSNFVTSVLSSYNPNVFKRGFYMAEYPYQEGTRPEASKALFKELAYGYALSFFYIHGNPSQLAHEQLVTISNIGNIQTGSRNPVFVLGSCKTNNFDRLERAIGEHLMIHPNTGIASLGASDLTGAGEDEALIRNILNHMNDSSMHTLGEVIYSVKNSAHDKAFNLLGDPTLRFGFPSPEIPLDFQKPLLDTLKQVTKITFEDTLPFSGVPRVYFDLLVGRRLDTVLTIPRGDTMEVFREGRYIYRGLFSVNSQGIYRPAFIIPRYYPITRENRYAHFFVYADKTPYGNIGLLDSLIVIEPDSGIIDITPPEISIFYNGEEIEDSMEVLPRSELEIRMSDENGISLYFGNLSLTIDNRDIIDLTPLFMFDYDDPTSGKAYYKLTPEVREGYRTLTVQGSDNFGNSKIKTYTILLLSPEGFVFKNIIPFPNPTDGKVFVGFETNKQVRVNLKIYTLRGHLIYESGEMFYPPGFQKIKWNGLDADGDVPANGVYFFKLTGRDIVSGEDQSWTGKIMILR